MPLYIFVPPHCKLFFHCKFARINSRNISDSPTKIILHKVLLNNMTSLRADVRIGLVISPSVSGAGNKKHS